MPVGFHIAYSNQGREEGRNLRLMIYGLPTTVFTGVSLVADVSL